MNLSDVPLSDLKEGVFTLAHFRELWLRDWYNLHRSFFVVVCVVGFEGRASVVGLGIIATEQLRFHTRLKFA